MHSRHEEPQLWMLDDHRAPGRDPKTGSTGTSNAFKRSRRPPGWGRTQWNYGSRLLSRFSPCGLKPRVRTRVRGHLPASQPSQTTLDKKLSRQERKTPHAPLKALATGEPMDERQWRGKVVSSRTRGPDWTVGNVPVNPGAPWGGLWPDSLPRGIGSMREPAADWPKSHVG